MTHTRVNTSLEKCFQCNGWNLREGLLLLIQFSRICMPGYFSFVLKHLIYPFPLGHYTHVKRHSSTAGYTIFIKDVLSYKGIVKSRDALVCHHVLYHHDRFIGMFSKQYRLIHIN